MLHCLNVAFIPFVGDIEEFACDIRSNILRVLETASQHRVAHDNVVEYAKCLFNNFRVPLFRGLVKVHNKIWDMRLISAGTGWITNPVAFIVAKRIQPLVRRISDTADVIDTFNSIDLANCDLHTFDVEQLYPSLDPKYCIQIVKIESIAYYRSQQVPFWTVLVDVIVKVIDVFSNSQLGSFSRSANQKFVFKQVQGVTFGLACAAQIANIVLSHLDKYVAQHFNCHN